MFELLYMVQENFVLHWTLCFLHIIMIACVASLRCIVVHQRAIERVY